MNVIEFKAGPEPKSIRLESAGAVTISLPHDDREYTISRKGVRLEAEQVRRVFGRHLPLALLDDPAIWAQLDPENGTYFLGGRI